MLPRRSGPLACVEASEVHLKLGQQSIGPLSILQVLFLAARRRMSCHAGFGE